jgi:hypothetical protein
MARVEIHTDEADAINAAIPRRLGYRLGCGGAESILAFAGPFIR